MPLLYNGMGAPGETGEVPMTDANIGPALVLWLLFVTNPTWKTPLDRTVVSKTLGISPSVFDCFAKGVSGNPSVLTTARLFSKIGKVAGYGETGCPTDPTTILALKTGLLNVAAVGRKIKAAKARKKGAGAGTPAKKAPAKRPAK